MSYESPPCSQPGTQVCARCAERFSTCCVILPDIAECCFPLSEAERAAIEAQAGPGAGVVRQANTPLFIKAMQELFPDERHAVTSLFAPDGDHWRLRIDARGACVFLGAEGCTLPRAARPGYCRIFPFWVRRGELWHFTLRDCQAQREQRGRPGLLNTFGLSLAEVLEMYAALRQGWGLPAKPARRFLPRDLFR